MKMAVILIINMYYLINKILKHNQLLNFLKCIV